MQAVLIRDIISSSQVSPEFMPPKQLPEATEYSNSELL